jgi:hypothetical protein
VTLLLRAVRWPPVLLCLATGAVVLALADHPADTVVVLCLLLPAAVGWLVDDPAANVTASARYGRRVQLAVRCSAAAAIAGLCWAAAVSWAGGAPRDAATLLVALTVVALAAGVTWGAVYAGPAAAVAWALAGLTRPPFEVTGARWWWVAAAAACWLGVATRDPVRR